MDKVLSRNAKALECLASGDPRRLTRTCACLLACLSCCYPDKGAGTTDDLLVVSAIRVAQEEHFAEYGSFFSTSMSTEDWYPDAPDGVPKAWMNEGHPSFARWRLLMPDLVTSNERTLSGVRIHAGDLARPPPPIPGSIEVWAEVPVEPWYLIVVSRALDGDCARAYLVSASKSSAVHLVGADDGKGANGCE